MLAALGHELIRNLAEASHLLLGSRNEVRDVWSRSCLALKGGYVVVG